jgi:hypothetical protein
LNVAAGVCSRIAATVPTSTMTKAAGETNAATPAPLRMLPPISATSASTTPTTESLSMRHPQ